MKLNWEDALAWGNSRFDAVKLTFQEYVPSAAGATKSSSAQ